MGKGHWSRREVIGASAGAAAGMLFAAPAKAAVSPSAVTPELIEAAKKEGKISYYAAIELNVAERLGKDVRNQISGHFGARGAFRRRADFPAHRAGERQRHPRGRRRQLDRRLALPRLEEEWLARAIPAGRGREEFSGRPVSIREGMYATACAWLEVIGYNTNLVKPEDAPKSYADLLDPKWQGKLVKGHPSYTGAILTTTFVLSRDLGWSYLEKLAQQKVMQVQSAGDPPKKIMLGERAVMADGNDYNLIVFKDQGKPVEAVYPAEGSPLIIVPSGVFKDAPNPNAARLFQSFFFSGGPADAGQ